MMPAACAASSADATWRAISAAACHGSAPVRASRAVSDSPLSSSIAISQLPSASLRVSATSASSWMVTMPGWAIVAAARASCTKRCVSVASEVCCGRRNFTATSRSRPRSRATNTMPNPPSPSLRPSVYLPTCIPAASAIAPSIS